MFDTVNLWIDQETVKANQVFTVYPDYLTNITEHQKQDGKIWISGNLHNYKMNISDNGISLKGSLAKYFLNDNLNTLTRSDTKEAFKKLSDETHIDMKEAKITRLDLAFNMLMNYPPEYYHKYMGESQYYKRFIQQKSLYYSNTNRVKLFYNKIAELKSKQQYIPDNFTNDNILRFELRFMRRLNTQLKDTINPVKLSDET